MININYCVRVQCSGRKLWVLAFNWWLLHPTFNDNSGLLLYITTKRAKQRPNIIGLASKLARSPSDWASERCAGSRSICRSPTSQITQAKGAAIVPDTTEIYSTNSNVIKWAPRPRYFQKRHYYFHLNKPPKGHDHTNFNNFNFTLSLFIPWVPCTN